MTKSNRGTETINSLLPLGAAVLLLMLVGLVIWFTQGLHLSKATEIDPIQVEQEKINSLLHKLNNDIEKAQQLRINKANAQADN